MSRLLIASTALLTFAGTASAHTTDVAHTHGQGLLIAAGFVAVGVVISKVMKRA